MSYEGYTEYKCECGEVDSADVYGEQPPACRCGKPFVARRDVDQTNVPTYYGKWRAMKPAPKIATVPESFCDRVLARPDVKTAIADEAVSIVNGARRSAYGRPEDNFARIAHMWTGYARAKGWSMEFTAADVSPMMRLMKEARLVESPDHRDSHVDIIGYAMTGYEISMREAA